MISSVLPDGPIHEESNYSDHQPRIEDSVVKEFKEVSIQGEHYSMEDRGFSVISELR